MQRVIYNNKTKSFYEKGDVVYSVLDNVNHTVDKVDIVGMNVICEDYTVLPLDSNLKATVNTLTNATIIDKRVKLKKTLNINIKYFDSEMPRIEKMAVGDWFDLRSIKDLNLKKGDFALIPLGVAMEFPKGFEAHVIPRSSTFKNFKVFQTNSLGLIDESYCGDNDMWFMPIFAVEDTVINKYDRVCQFRVMRKMPDITFTEVESLGNADRGGHGSSGVK